jgi:hypothetical protein
VTKIYTRWSFKGQNVREKLAQYEQELKLIYDVKRKDKEIYELDLKDFQQYKDLEKLSDKLGLELRIVSNAEWLAVLYHNNQFDKEK